MIFAGTVTSLAVDALREPAVRFRRITIVAEQAFFGDFATEVGLIGTVVARAHCPVAAVRGIPAHRQFNETTGVRAMYVSAGVRSGANCEIDSALENIAAADLGAAQTHGAALLNRTVTALRWRVDKPVQRRHGRRGAEGPGHSRSAVRIVNGGVARPAYRSVDVPRFGRARNRDARYCDDQERPAHLSVRAIQSLDRGTSWPAHFAVRCEARCETRRWRRRGYPHLPARRPARHGPPEIPAAGAATFGIRRWRQPR